MADKLGKLSLLNYLFENRQLAAMEDGKPVNVSSPEALAILAVLSYHEHPRKMFFLFPSVYEAERFLQFVGDYLGEEEVFMFPYDEIFRSSALGVSPEMRDERLSAVSSIFSKKPSILVSHSSASSLLIMPKERYEENLFLLKKGQEDKTQKEILDLLVSLGYKEEDRVSQAGQFAHRGEIIDIFDATETDPFRIEMFGDEIEEIRRFKARDERSFEKTDSVLIHPASLYLLSKEEIESGSSEVEKEVDHSSMHNKDRLAFDDLSERAANLLLDVRLGSLPDISARLYPLFHPEETTILDYLRGYERYLYRAKETEEERVRVKAREKEYFRKAINTNSSLELEHVYSISSPDFHLFHETVYDEDKDPFLVRDNSYHAISYAASREMIETYLQEGYKIRIALPEPNLTNYINYLRDNKIPYSLYPTHSDLMLFEGRITRGFEIPEEKHVYLSAKEIYGVSDQKTRFLSRYKEAKIIRKYEDLKPGDYVVHEVNGIGKFVGVAVLKGLEYLKVQYADSAVFYLPLSQYKMIRKYASREGYAPALDHLGGSSWSRKKARIRSRVSFLADQLLAIYAERQTRPGYAFPREAELEDQFQKEFPYPYTPAQLRCIQEIFADMELPRPMDRLIAGDVGFGKTEIAFNAAFKAIIGHKQVAFLCPTTILSNQHFKTASQRFSSWGIRICVFNRFVPLPEQKKNIALIREGKMDLVIGTHRLLSNDIMFKDLGLLIVDEEQKFGVTHKERIKEKAKNVDCLTLTATPIPRTLQMSLLNIRSLSLLEDAPLNRMPVKTYIVKYDSELIEEVIEKELDRKGQVYFLHNDIKSIYSVQNVLSKKFPGHNVGVCHARMSESDIESTMNDFYTGKIEVLVCTSIIESGLDIPNVNTIIVENADHFGLSQLYQIKGRVGRSDRLAYAYFLFRDSGKLSDEAKKRLKALKDFTELGSGYKIAMQDLNIRGAGDILGSEQAGFVDTLGYEAYMDLIKEVVSEKRLVKQAVIEDKKQAFELSFTLDAHIPEDYGNESQRITMYRELSDCSTEEQISDFGKKLTDIYGPYPEEVANLLVKKHIENSLNDGSYDAFVEGLGFYSIKMSEKYSSKPGIYKRWEEVLAPMFDKLRIKVEGKSFVFVLTKTKDYLQDLLFLTEELKKDEK
ncbi:MAG: transcription-repair coupling factor [Bacilli bacterium]|jgi:transcription-repair coupling factor (superfamily II helicase)|nr:transcription-repair coupling factor [Bacilli bacterium]